MPIPRPPIPSIDRLAEVKADGARAQLALEVVGPLIEAREQTVLRTALTEFRNSQLTPDRAYMHLAAINGLRALKDELDSKVRLAQDATKKIISLDAYRAPKGDGVSEDQS